jgi:hypothetical protein
MFCASLVGLCSMARSSPGLADAGVSWHMVPSALNSGKAAIDVSLGPPLIRASRPNDMLDDLSNTAVAAQSTKMIATPLRRGGRDLLMLISPCVLANLAIIRCWTLRQFYQIASLRQGILRRNES